MSFIDKPVAVRIGEELDPKIIGDFIRKHIPGVSGEPLIEQFPSGFSNLSYSISMGGRDIVLRRPPVGAKRIKAGHDMRREYNVMGKLRPVYPPAPNVIAYCDDESLIGAEFYLMDRVKGIILRKELPPEMTMDEASARKMSEALVDNLVAIHAIDYAAVGLGDLGKPDGFVERQLTGWAERWEKSKTEDMPEVDEIIGWCKKNLPKSPASTLIHNDYKYDNIVLDQNDMSKIIGVLDWEMSTLGDPLFDLGVALSYWIGPDDPEDFHLIRTVPTHIKGSLTRKEFLARYAEKTGRDVSQIPFYYAFALFKLAVIAQQIYYRFTKGFTNDERFALLLAGVKVLLKYSTRAIEAGAIL